MSFQDICGGILKREEMLVSGHARLVLSSKIYYLQASLLCPMAKTTPRSNSTVITVSM